LHASVEQVKIKSRIAKIVMIKKIEDFTGQGQLCFFEEERLAQPYIDAAVIRNSDLVPAIDEKKSSCVLSIEARHRLATAIASFTAEIPRVGETIVSIDVERVPLV